MPDHPVFIEASVSLDPGREFMKGLPDMAERARRSVREDASSYRDVLVGAAGLFSNPPLADTGTYTAGNVKPNEHKTTVCAEKIMIEKAAKAGFTTAVGFVVASSASIEEIDSIVDVANATLPPCEPCSSYFAMSALMREDTVIVSIGLDSDRRQVQLYDELRATYLSRDLTRLLEIPIRFGFENWEERVDLYDDLSATERELSPAARRPIGKLVETALLTKI